MSSSLSPTQKSGILMLLILLELAMLSFWRSGRMLGNAAPFVFFFLSLLIGIFPLYSLRNSKDEKQGDIPGKVAGNKQGSLIYYGLFFLGILIGIPLFIQVLSQYPADISQSDVIPQIEVMVRRFFHEGTSPYQTIHEFGYPLFSPYMPLQWGPFILPDLLGMDYRWLGYVALVGASLFTVSRVNKPLTNKWTKWGIAILPGLMIWAILYQTDMVVGQSVAPLITAYYLLLAVSLFRGNILIQAIALSLCLLSKYYIALWVPLYLWVLFQTHPRKSVFTSMGIIGGAVLICYIVPFLSQDWTIFSRGMAYHLQHTLGNWSDLSIRTGSGKPVILAQGVGLATYFFQYWPGEISDKLNALQLTQILTVLATLLGSLWFLHKRRYADYPLVLLASLKLYLVCYLHFNPMPFIYYFLPLIFVSVAIWGAVSIRLYSKTVSPNH